MIFPSFTRIFLMSFQFCCLTSQVLAKGPQRPQNQCQATNSRQHLPTLILIQLINKPTETRFYNHSKNQVVTHTTQLNKMQRSGFVQLLVYLPAYLLPIWQPCIAVYGTASCSAITAAEATLTSHMECATSNDCNSTGCSPKISSFFSRLFCKNTVFQFDPKITF